MQYYLAMIYMWLRFIVHDHLKSGLKQIFGGGGEFVDIKLTGFLPAGTHVCEEGKNQFTMCLDAAYYDTVLDSYLIEFQMRDDGYFIQRHSLPEFIPTLTLEKEYLSGGDISLFLAVIRNYLQAYVFKREEIARVKVWRISSRFLDKENMLNL